MSRLTLPLRLTILALAVPALAGCLTPTAKPAPSAAIVAARQGIGARPAGCPAGALATISPLVATFPFDEAALDQEGRARLRTAADWLTCNAGVPVSILPTADNHGDAAHKLALASARGQAVLDALRAAGAKTAVVHIAAPGATDPLTGPHLVIQADGRGW
jgi:outer membrane protein OmpA-like peptidoglycan-associated protein